MARAGTVSAASAAGWEAPSNQSPNTNLSTVVLTQPAHRTQTRQQPQAVPHTENRPTPSEADIFTELLSRAQARSKHGIVSTVSLSHTLSFPNHSPLAKDSSPGPG